MTTIPLLSFPNITAHSPVNLLEEQITTAEMILDEHFELYCIPPRDNARLIEKFQRSVIIVIISCGYHSYVINSESFEISFEVLDVKKELRVLMSRPTLQYFQGSDLNIITALIAKNDDSTYEITTSKHVLSHSKNEISYHFNEIADLQAFELIDNLNNLIPCQIQRDRVSRCIDRLNTPKTALFEKKIAKAARIIKHNFSSRHLSLISNDPLFPKNRLQRSAIVLVMKNHEQNILNCGTTDDLTANLAIINEDLRVLIYQQWNAQPDNACITMDMLCFERLDNNTYDCEAFVDKFSLWSEDKNFSETTKEKVTQFELGSLLHKKIPSFEYLMQVSTLLAQLKVPIG